MYAQASIGEAGMFGGKLRCLGGEAGFFGGKLRYLEGSWDIWGEAGMFGGGVELPPCCPQ